MMSSDLIDTRTRILEAARALLEGREKAAVRMSDIAARAGISRQAVYLHFENRAELLIALTRHMDVQLDVEGRLVASRTARTGRERLRAYVAFWGEFVPRIEPVAEALIAMQETDAAAAQVWGQRMQDVHDGCRMAILALERDADLAPGWTVDTATDLLWAMLSVEIWVKLKTRGWSTADYIVRMQLATERALTHIH